MLIDWFTVAAQMLNFVILVWLFKRFLYKPIHDAIDAREKRIADELADAVAKKTEAQKQRDDFQEKNKTFDEQRSALFAKATDEAKAEHERLLDEARKEAEIVRAGQAAALRNDQARLGTEITRMARDEVFGIARKTLADLATVSLEERVGEVFTRRLREMDGKAKQEFGEALKTSPEASIVRSAFDLPAEQKAAIQNALNETFSAEIRLRFEIAKDKICGIELIAHGQKLAWSIADYLTVLEQKVGALMEAQSVPEAKATPKPEAASTSALEPDTATTATPKPELASALMSKTKPASTSASEPDAASTPTPTPEAASTSAPEADTASAPTSKPEPASTFTAERDAANTPTSNPVAPTEAI